MPEHEKEQNYTGYIDSFFAELENDDFHNYFIKRVKDNDYTYEIHKKISNKIVDREWLEIIESCLIPLDEIVRKPRRFIKQEEDIVSIALAKRITTESVKHLAQHTNMISSIDKKGLVTPERILNINKEDSVEVYENRFVYTLLLKLHAFVSKRMSLILASMEENETSLVRTVNNFRIDDYKYNCKLELSCTKIERLDSETGDVTQMTDLQRVGRIASIVRDFLSSPFAAEMKKSPLVRPPITRTNAILKDHNLKKALILWQFVESYDKDGFSVENDSTSDRINGPYIDDLNNTLFLNYVYLREYLGHDKSIEKNSAPATKRKMPKTVVGSVFDESNLTDEDLKRIYDRLMSKKVKAQRLNRGKYNAIIDRAIKQHMKNKLEKEQKSDAGTAADKTKKTAKKSAATADKPKRPPQRPQAR